MNNGDHVVVVAKVTDCKHIQNKYLQGRILRLDKVCDRFYRYDLSTGRNVLFHKHEILILNQNIDAQIIQV